MTVADTGAPHRPGAGPVVLKLRLPAGPATPRALVLSAGVHATIALALLAAGLLHRSPTTTSATPVRLVAAKGVPKAPPRKVARTKPPRPAPPSPSPRVVEPERPPPDPAPGVAPRPVESVPAPPVAKKKPPREASKPAAREVPPPAAPKTPAAEAVVTPAPDPGVTATVEGGSFPYDYYLDSVVRKVSGAWHKSRATRPARSCVLYFELARSGAVSGVVVEISSGSVPYDLSAQRAVELAAPLPPLPPAFAGSVLKVHFEFIP